MKMEYIAIIALVAALAYIVMGVVAPEIAVIATPTGFDLTPSINLDGSAYVEPSEFSAKFIGVGE